MSINQRIFRDSIVVTGLTIIARALGFLLPVLIAMLFGAAGEADAFYLASTIPTFLVNVFVVALSSAIVPVLIEQWTHAPATADETIGAIALVLAICAGLAIGLLALLIPSTLPSIAHGMAAQSLALSVELTIMLLPMVLLSTLIGLASAILNARRQFAGPALAPGLRAVIVMGAALVGYRSVGIYAVVLGLLIGEFLSLLALGLLVWRAGVRPRLALRVPHSVVRVLGLSLPMIVGMSVIQFNPIIDRLMAAALGEGSISALDYADKVLAIPTALLGAGFLVVILSHWSHAAAEGNIDQLRLSVQRAITSVSFITIPIALLLFMSSRSIVLLLFQRGAFDSTATATTAPVLAILALGLPLHAIGLIFVRIQLVFQKTRTLMILGLANALLNLTFNYLFIRLMGLPGIALSTSLTYLLVALSLWLMSTGSIGQVFQRSVRLSLGKIGVAALGFAVVLGLFRLALSDAYPGTALLGGMLVGGVVYFVIAYIEGVEAATSLYAWVAQHIRSVTAVLAGGAR